MGPPKTDQPSVSSSLYRRLPKQWWDSAKKKGKLQTLPLSRFMPNSRDTDGLSVSRAELSSIEIASTTSTGKRDCLAEFPVGVVTSRGLTVEPKPTDHDPGHAVIPQMNYAAREDPATELVVEEHAKAIMDAAKIVWPIGDV